MANLRVGPRLTRVQQKARDKGNRDRRLWQKTYTPGGFLLRAREVFGKTELQLAALALKVDRLRMEGLVPELRAVSAGKFVMGKDSSPLLQPDNLPVGEITISRPFDIGRYEVTNREFEVFVRLRGYENEEYWSAEGRVWKKEQSSDITGPKWWETGEHNSGPNSPHYPVVGVTYYEAEAYCNWLSRVTRQKFRIPTEAEGEWAAREIDGREFPWGNEWDPSKVASGTRGSQPVSFHPEGGSHFGAEDLSGNVREWRSDWYNAKGYDPKALVDPQGPPAGMANLYKVVRGGSMLNTDRDSFTTYRRACSRPQDRNYYSGFRVVREK
ncbi:MAG: SUMF1/EgtB/PvdO family nonheme iron enzyme [Candidatus Saganbacteria bacterium]|nr:SUMF1/EgtB/PvdO family nonheme iron enzyme [Candidatus Saganbacteria bacterium]